MCVQAGATRFWQEVFITAHERSLAGQPTPGAEVFLLTQAASGGWHSRHPVAHAAGATAVYGTSRHGGKLEAAS